MRQADQGTQCIAFKDQGPRSLPSSDTDDDPRTIDRQMVDQAEQIVWWESSHHMNTHCRAYLGVARMASRLT